MTREEEVGKVKRGRIVAVRASKTIEVLELRVGYVKDRFGKLCRQDIKRPNVLAFMRSYEAQRKLETRDRVRGIGEQICGYADVEGDGYNPFRNLNGQMIPNISTPRPDVTEPRDVMRLFKLISAPSARARFGDVVGLALFASSTACQARITSASRPGCRLPAYLRKIGYEPQNGGSDNQPLASALIRLSSLATL